MELTKERIKQRLEICQQLNKNLKQFESLGKQLMEIDNDISFYNTDIRLLNVILENYELGNLIFNDGYIYCVVEREEQNNYEKNLGVRNFIAKKVKWDLNLSDELYDIQEEKLTDSGGFDDFSIYHIQERK